MNLDLSSLECTNESKDNIADENVEITAQQVIPAPAKPEHTAEGVVRAAEDEETDNLRIILQVYHHQFKHDLAVLAKDLSSESLSSKGTAELKDLRRKCDMILGAASATHNKKKLFNSLIYIIEKLGSTSEMAAAGVNLKGLTGVAVNDPDFQKDLMRLSLKYLSAKEVEPEVSAGMRLFTLMMQVNHNNSLLLRESIPLGNQTEAKNITQPNINPEKASKANELFNDL